MLKQIVVGEREHPVKYHGQVKHIVFACNYCGNEFEKPQSYVKKQMKTRSGACCFCSPDCRRHYLKTGAPKPKPVTTKSKKNMWNFLFERVFPESS